MATSHAVQPAGISVSTTWPEYRVISAGIGIVAFAVMTALGAYVRIPLPWTPVPITLQTLFVSLAGATLGPVFGPASQGLYLAAGAAGVPLFAGGLGGAGGSAGRPDDRVSAGIRAGHRLHRLADPPARGARNSLDPALHGGRDPGGVRLRRCLAGVESESAACRRAGPGAAAVPAGRCGEAVRGRRSCARGAAAHPAGVPLGGDGGDRTFSAAG